MNYDTDLWDSIKVCDPNTALYIVGEHSKNGNITILENTWVYTLANIGSFINFNYYKWLSICKDVLNIIEQEEFHISDAFEITIKLCLLYKNSHMYINPPKLDLRTLRKKIVDKFDTDFKLSNKGLMQFEPYLPKDLEERDFCIKIISGLISVWVDKKHQDFRNCLEYIDRKKYDIEIPSNIHLEWGDQHTSMNIIIWECLSKLDPSFEILKRLYTYNYSKKCHKINISFMLATSALIYSDKDITWDDKEMRIINNVIENSKNIYKQIDIGNDNETSDTNNNKALAFENFVPTKSSNVSFYNTLSYEDDMYKPKQHKTIEYNKK